MKNLKPKDIIYIEYAYRICKATVVNNYPEERKIVLKIWMFNYISFFSYDKRIFNYYSCLFNNFNILNKNI